MTRRKRLPDSWQLVHVVSLCTLGPCNINLSSYCISTNMDPIEAALTAIESRDLEEQLVYQKYADIYSVDRSTLSRRHRGITRSRKDGYEKQRNLSNQEETELLQYIRTLTKRGLPSTCQMVQSFASTIAHREVSISWVDRFTAKNQESLIS